jgi:hypothetical protein
MLVSALLRRLDAEGGAGAVLRRGDLDAGAVILVIAERGEIRAMLEQKRDVTGRRLAWARTGPDPASSAEAVTKYLESRVRSDPDLWIVELDGAQAERLAADITGEG